MAELTEQRVREIVREEIAAEAARQATAARAGLIEALARMQDRGRVSRTALLGGDTQTDTPPADSSAL